MCCSQNCGKTVGTKAAELGSDILYSVERLLATGINVEELVFRCGKNDFFFQE